jgi:hypothetical protein
MTVAGLKKAFRDLRAAALEFPETHEALPWGESAFKVAQKKVFCFLSLQPTHLSLTCKLPESHHLARMLPFAAPTGYGLGKSGWVTARFPLSTKAPPVELMRLWLIESYRAVAPKRLSRVTHGTTSMSDS